MTLGGLPETTATPHRLGRCRIGTVQDETVPDETVQDETVQDETGRRLTRLGTRLRIRSKTGSEVDRRIYSSSRPCHAFEVIGRP